MQIFAMAVIDVINAIVVSPINIQGSVSYFASSFLPTIKAIITGKAIHPEIFINKYNGDCHQRIFVFSSVSFMIRKMPFFWRPDYSKKLRFFKVFAIVFLFLVFELFMRV